MTDHTIAKPELSLAKHFPKSIEEKIPDYINKVYSKHSFKDDKVISLPFLDINSSKEEYQKYFNNSWILTEALFSSLKYKESFYKKPYHLLRYPLVFYYAHVACLYVNKMLLAGLIDKTIDKEFEKTFETGVDEMTWDIDMKDNNINWPDLEVVQSYRRKAYDLITKVINKNEKLFANKVSQESPLWSLLMSFEHERIHLETSSVLVREMDIKYIRSPKLLMREDHFNQENEPAYTKTNYPKNELVKIESQEVVIEKKDLSTYGWDNEFGRDDSKADSFDVSKFLISNAEFFEFVKNNGYYEDRYWCAKGLSWRKFRNIYHPTFWVPNGPKGSKLFKFRTCFEIIDMKWDYPVIANHYEAKAFCRYKSESENKNYRLPFEIEHKALADFESDPVKSEFSENFNFNLQNFSENPVNINKQGENGLCDIHGNLWQWLEDDFYPLEGFKIHDYYKDFSTPCFDDKHKMIAGSSFFSTGNVASIYSRFHFRPHFFQHAGFRIVKDNRHSLNKKIKIELETKNQKDGCEYVIFRENNKLKVLEKEKFNKKHKDIS